MEDSGPNNDDVTEHLFKVLTAMLERLGVECRGVEAVRLASHVLEVAAYEVAREHGNSHVTRLILMSAELDKIAQAIAASEASRAAEKVRLRQPLRTRELDLATVQ